MKKLNQPKGLPEGSLFATLTYDAHSTSWKWRIVLWRMGADGRQEELMKDYAWTRRGAKFAARKLLRRWKRNKYPDGYQEVWLLK